MSCKIILTTHDGITVSGHVYCASYYNERFQAIRVSILGKEHTAWSVGENKTYTGDNIFLHLRTTIANEGILSGVGCEYPFKFTLPARDIPSSYEEKYGFIRYSMKAKVEIPLGKDYKDKKFVKIISPINFNNITEQLQLNPIIYEADENPMLLFCRPLGLITMRVHLQKEAFVLGEVVKIKVDINNMSYMSLKELTITMEMVRRTPSPTLIQQKFITAYQIQSNLSEIPTLSSKGDSYVI